MMRPQWGILPLAGLAEVGWAAGLKHAETLTDWLLTVVLAITSLWLASRAVRYMPTSTVYTVFVGLGAAGTAMADWVFFGVPFHWPVLAFIVLLLVGVIGLQQVND
ncbi:DMT family transporter [Salinicola salarius]|jgi:paired small multidrug resistance pump|uniref:DMT family transporter n=1 Tax=Salinicola salarius TaxID=430457 RepID=UPI001ABF08B2|nr:SMR family transporter [Salinicola salarius]MDF3918036.1 SMR family transporter [Salinicola salarius]MEC8917550.1 SMR family transporter [Pseudomonadota bacterium]MED5501698.1 SMR family transporter [Pseudomonadota bacterium]